MIGIKLSPRMLRSRTVNQERLKARLAELDEVRKNSERNPEAFEQLLHNISKLMACYGYTSLKDQHILLGQCGTKWAKIYNKALLQFWNPKNQEAN